MSIESLYSGLLGREVDQGAYGTYSGWNDDQIRSAILGSQEYANRQSSSQPQQQQQQQQPSGGGGGDISSLYRQLLGRDVDQGAYATYAGWNPDQIRQAIVNSPEYAQRQGGGGGQPANVNEQELANQVFNLYRTNQNYDQLLNQLNAAPQDADYYRARIGLIGKQMGWQTGQNTGDRNTVYQRELESYLPGARASGLSDAEINSLISQNAAQQSAVNQERIASDAKAPQGWVNQNIPGGWGTLAGAALLAAPYALPALGFGGTAAGTGALTTDAILASTGFVPAAGTAGFTLPGALSAGGGALSVADILASTGFTPTAGSSFNIIPGAAYTVADAATLASRWTPEIIAQANASSDPIGYISSLADATPEELALFTTPATAGIGSILSSVGSALKPSLGGLGTLGGLGLLAGGTGAGGAGTTPTTGGAMASTPSTYAPRGQVSYDPLLSLLAPKQISRNMNSLLG